MSPRSAEQFAALREGSRARILAAALVVFSRYGYEGASVRLIAREAGVAQGLMYRHFAGKEDLLRAIFQQGMRDVQASFEASAAGATPRARLEHLIRHSFETVQAQLPFWRLSYSLRTQPAVLLGLAAEIQGWSATIRGRLEALLRELGVAEPAIESALLFAQIDGVAQHYALDPEHYPLAAVVEALIARYRTRDGGA